MRFVRTEDLKPGMRIGRPIYNRNGVLLFDRDSKLNDSTISRISNFGLIGIYVLEPAEPVPPLSEEDIEFERFQTMNVFALADELQEIRMTKRARKIEQISNLIVANYGHLNHKINFVQNIRSFEDYVIKHSLNVAILSALICHQLNVSISDLSDVMLASLIHDLGKTMVSSDKLVGLDEDKIERLLDASQDAGFEIIENIFASKPSIKRICTQTNYVLTNLKYNKGGDPIKQTIGTMILCVAETFDIMTAVSPVGKREPVSFISAIRYLTEHPEIFNKKVVEALINSINIITPGTSVELSNGTQALILQVNPRDFLSPMVLCFSNNSIIDLADKRLYGDIKILDVVKTMDQRNVIDPKTLAMYGLSTN